MELGIPLRRGSIGKPGGGAFTELSGEGGLWKPSVYPYGSSARDTWREGSVTGYLKDTEMKALETGISLHRGPVGEPGRVLRLPVILLSVNERCILYGSSLTL